MGTFIAVEFLEVGKGHVSKSFYCTRKENKMSKVMIKVVCAWCDKVLREGHPDAEVSHGICGECKREYFDKNVSRNWQCANCGTTNRRTHSHCSFCGVMK